MNAIATWKQYWKKSSSNLLKYPQTNNFSINVYLIYDTKFCYNYLKEVHAFCSTFMNFLSDFASIPACDKAFDSLWLLDFRKINGTKCAESQKQSLFSVFQISCAYFSLLSFHTINNLVENSFAELWKKWFSFNGKSFLKPQLKKGNRNFPPINVIFSRFNCQITDHEWKMHKTVAKTVFCD